MNNLATYIEYLLMTQHYVFVPGIGGFMLQKKSGRIIHTPSSENATEGFRLIPPYYEVSFNRFLTHDDGLLVNTYMEANHATFEEASTCIGQEIAVLRKKLEQEERYPLGNLGCLYYDKECHISFQPSPNGIPQPRSFGLETIEIQRQESRPARNEKPDLQENGKYVISIRKRWLQHAAVIILILGCFFADFSSFRSHDNHVNNYASMINREILSGNQRPNTLIDHSWEEILDDESFSVDEAGNLVPVETIDTCLLSTRQSDRAFSGSEEKVFPTPHAQENDTVVTTSGKAYYIIIASCPTMEKARQDIQRFSRLGYENINILEKDGRYRLYINVFTQKPSAEDYLNDLRQVATFHDAWLLPVRQNSISHISKNKHNEQLSMELSHLTTRTERDQG